LINDGVAPENIVFLNFEERENLHLTNWITLYDEIIEKVNPKEKYYIFLDEVQLIIDFEKLVNSLFTKKNIDLYVTGSNAYLLSSELATLLTGRYIALNLQTYSFKEYTSALAFIQYRKERFTWQEKYKNAKPDCLIFIRDNRDYITNVQIFNTKCYI
jgi:predicted AAA+ superfamily ATPase